MKQTGAVVTEADENPGSSSMAPETLARTQPKSDPYSPNYGSSSMDRGGWSLNPNILLISNVLILELYMSICEIDYISMVVN